MKSTDGMGVYRKYLGKRFIRGIQIPLLLAVLSFWYDYISLF